MASIIWSTKPYQLTDVTYSTATLVYGNTLPVTVYTQGYANGSSIYYSLSGHETGTGSAVISHYFGDFGKAIFNIPTTADFSNGPAAFGFTIHDQNAYNASTQLVPASNKSTNNIILATAPYTINITSDVQNYNLATEMAALGWTSAAGTFTANITVGAGVYIWSDSTAIAAFDTGTFGGITNNVINITNNGYIMGKGGVGGSGGVGLSAVMVVGGNGGPAINLQHNVTIVNNTGAFIGGGGGGGGSAQSVSPQGTSAKNAGSVGGGGGAGGGRGGAATETSGIAGGAGGAVGVVGSNGSDAGTFPSNENIVGSGGGGGRIMPGSGGLGGYWGLTPVATGYNNLGGKGGGAGGGGGGSGSAVSGTPNPPVKGYGGDGGGSNGAGSIGSQVGGQPTSPGVTGGAAGGGGGGWGAAGADGVIYSAPLKKSVGGTGGKAIALNGQTATRSGPGTTYGTVA